MNCRKCASFPCRCKPRKPSPKRTNWKLRYQILEMNNKRSLDEMEGLAIGWKKRSEVAEGKLKAAEQRIAELEAERQGPTYKCEQCGQPFEFTHRVRLCSDACTKLFLEANQPTLWQRFKAWRQR